MKLRLLCAHDEWPRRCGAAKQRDELATFQLIEVASEAKSQERLARYRIGADQSAGIAGVLQRQTCRAPYPTPRRGISTDDRSICRLDYGTRYGFGLAHLLALKLSTV